MEEDMVGQVKTKQFRRLTTFFKFRNLVLGLWLVSSLVPVLICLLALLLHKKNVRLLNGLNRGENGGKEKKT